MCSRMCSLEQVWKNKTQTWAWSPGKAEKTNVEPVGSGKGQKPDLGAKRGSGKHGKGKQTNFGGLEGVWKGKFVGLEGIRKGQNPNLVARKRSRNGQKSQIFGTQNQKKSNLGADSYLLYILPAAPAYNRPSNYKCCC